MIKMIELPYSLNALEPFYSKETLDLHYNILYKGYVDKTNATLINLETARAKSDFKNIKCLEKELSFQGSGAILHEMFFENMKPASEITRLDCRLAQKIIEDFGSFDAFKKQFSEAAATVEASGWCLLVWVPNFRKLEILQCENIFNRLFLCYLANYSFTNKSPISQSNILHNLSIVLNSILTVSLRIIFLTLDLEPSICLISQ